VADYLADTLLPKVKQNLIIDAENTADDELLRGFVRAALSYAERFQNKKCGCYFRAGAKIAAVTEQGVIMLASHFYESRDGSTGGFFSDRMTGGERARAAIDALLRMDKDWVV
jgi:hypothetical protein